MSARSTRRRLLGAPATLLLIGCAAAGEAKAAELDGELIDACAAFQKAAAESKRLDNLPDSPDEECTEAGAAYNDALRAVMACASPTTPEGVQGKAGAAFTALRIDNEPDLGDRWEEQAATSVVLAMRCLADVAGAQV